MEQGVTRYPWSHISSYVFGSLLGQGKNKYSIDFHVFLLLNFFSPFMYNTGTKSKLYTIEILVILFDWRSLVPRFFCFGPSGLTHLKISNLINFEIIFILNFSTIRP